MVGVVSASLTFGLVPAVQAQESVNNLDTVISDMTEENDETFNYKGEQGRRFTGPGTIVMGSNSHGDKTPSYYREHLVYGDYKDSDTWNAMIPWLEVFTHRSSNAQNTSVEMSNIKMYVLRKSTGKWQEVDSSAIDGMDYPKHGAGGEEQSIEIKTEGANKVVALGDDENRMFHGWGSEVDTRQLPEGFSTDDIKAVFTTVNARLVKKDENGVDDRDKSSYHLQMGADYYPEKGVRTRDELMLMTNEKFQEMRGPDGKPAGNYFPGVGVARAKKLTNEWQAFNFATIWDEEGRIAQDDHSLPIQERAISIDELRKNPPPLD